jgi:hypothetical protein
MRGTTTRLHSSVRFLLNCGYRSCKIEIGSKGSENHGDDLRMLPIHNWHQDSVLLRFKRILFSV